MYGLLLESLTTYRLALTAHEGLLKCTLDGIRDKFLSDFITQLWF